MKTRSVIRRIICTLFAFVLTASLLTVPVMAEELIQPDVDLDIKIESDTEELTGTDDDEHLEGKLSGEGNLPKEHSDKENLTDELSDKGTLTENLFDEGRSSSIPDEKQKEELSQMEPVSLPIEPKITSSEINDTSLQDLPNLTSLDDIDPDTEAGEYKLIWDDSTGAVTTVEVNGAQVSRGAPVKAGDGVTLRVTPGADKTITECKYSCTRIEETQEGPEPISYPESLLTLPTNPTFSFSVPNITTDVTITVVLSQSYPVWVAGTQVTDANKGNILSDGTNSVAFDPETRTLKLTNATVEGTIEFYYDEPVTLLIAGENTVEGVMTVSEAGDTAGFGITSRSDLSIKPFGDTPALTVFAPDADNACVIQAEDADLLIEETTTVEVFAGDAEEASIGIQANNITVAGQLDAYAGEASSSSGIVCDTLTVKNGISASGGTVSAYGADCPGGSSTGILAQKQVEIESNASLTANGGAASAISQGLNAGEKVTVFGELQCSSSTGIEGSTAIQCAEISTSGMLTAESTSSAEGQCIAISVGSFEVTAGSVSAAAGTGKLTGSEPGSIAISADSISISGGSILAESAGKALSGKPSFTNGYIPVVKISDSSITEVQRTEAVDTPATYFHKYLQIISSVITVNPETTTVPEGGKAMLTAHVDGSYDVRWSSGDSSIVSVNAATGEITGVAPGKTRVTASAYLSDGTTLMESAFCEVTVTAADIPLESIILLPERISLCSGNTSTLQYILYPSNTIDKNITWSAEGDTDSISYTVNPEAGTVIITGVKAGSVALTAASASGKRAYCSITVSDYVITYLDNSGMWYYDKSDGFTVSASGPLSDFTGVLIDGVSVPRFSGNQQNWAVAEQGGKTVLTFSKQYMASLSHGKHTIRLAFTGMTTPEKNIYIQLSTDPPITGDAPVAPFVLAFLLSGFGFAAACSVKKREK